MLTYFLLIIFFTYFYVAITFNPEEVADNMKKYGGFIPGIRAGSPPRSTWTTSSPASPLPGSLYLGLDRAAAAHRDHLWSVPTRTSRSAAPPAHHRGCRSETVKQIESQLSSATTRGSSAECASS